MAQIGFPSLILILVVALIIFGPSKLPEIGKAVGNTFREFKNSMDDLTSDSKTESEKSSDSNSQKNEEK